MLPIVPQLFVVIIVCCWIDPLRKIDSFWDNRENTSTTKISLFTVVANRIPTLGNDENGNVSVGKEWPLCKPWAYRTSLGCLDKVPSIQNSPSKGGQWIECMHASAHTPEREAGGIHRNFWDLVAQACQTFPLYSNTTFQGEFWPEYRISSNRARGFYFSHPLNLHLLFERSFY